ncbi:28S rRNA (cytosine-C(5))-methyltransferase [Anopheles bellator]|uniref:28S rRNA (cytosine-C(5))-methyltransferase n=1 Tax=Anopheles bellator TaxID=139047 RepID=UPI002647344A|nr:28S rRNA (cytosine-C(5))-methyltransferase [Anopheles bellator]
MELDVIPLGLPPTKIPVPPNYRNASRILRQVIEEKKNLKSLLQAEKHFRAGRSIMNRIMENLSQINAIIEHMNLAVTHPRMNVWLARVLIAELLFGRGELVGSSLPVECIRSCDHQIREAFQATKSSVPAVTIFKEPRFVRLNTAVLNMEDAKQLLKEEGWILVDDVYASYRAFLDRVSALSDYEYTVDFHFNDLLVFPNSSKGYWARAEHLRSKFFLQNKACLLPTFLLKPTKKSVVLDMCSAPGLKTTHLANLMKNKGRIYAVERNDDRYKLLCQYTAQFGVIKTIHGDCLDITDDQVPGVEYVLLDPSCSGSGMLDRLRMKEPVDESRLYKLAGLQYKLLSHAMNAYPNVRRIVYSTCSIHVEENEQVVMGVLRHNGHFKLLNARTELGMEWLHVGSPEYVGVGEHCLYARSEVDLGLIGMFVAVFSRCEEGEQNDIAQEQQKYSYQRLATVGQSTTKARKDPHVPREIEENNADNNGNTILPSQNGMKHNVHNPFEKTSARNSDLHEQTLTQENENIGIDAEVVNKKKDKRKKRKSEIQNDTVDHYSDTIATTVAEEVKKDKHDKSNSEMASELVREKVKRKKVKQQIEDQILDQPDGTVEAESNLKIYNNVENLSEIVDKKVKRKKRKHQAEDNILDLVDEIVEAKEDRNNIENVPEAVDMVKEKRKKLKKKDKKNSGLEQTEATIEVETNTKMENHIVIEIEKVEKKENRKRRNHQPEDNILDHTETVEEKEDVNKVGNVPEVVDVVKEKRKKQKKKDKENSGLEQTETTIKAETSSQIVIASEKVDKKEKRKKTETEH